MDDATLTAVREALTPLDAVRVAFVFGSRVAGTPRPDSDSDLDLGVLFARDADAIALHVRICRDYEDDAPRPLPPRGDRAVDRQVSHPRTASRTTSTISAPSRPPPRPGSRRSRPRWQARR